MLVSSNASGTETVSLASAAMSVDSGPESEFDFGDDLDAEPKMVAVSGSETLLHPRAKMRS